MAFLVENLDERDSGACNAGEDMGCPARGGSGAAEALLRCGDPGWRLKEVLDRRFNALTLEILARSDPSSTTAAYLRFWQVYLRLRRAAMGSWIMLTLVKGEMEDVPEPFLAPLKEHRERLRRAVARLVVQGQARNEVRSTLDPEAVTEGFLSFCASSGDVPDCPGAAGSASRFDLFWRPIATLRNARSARAVNPGTESPRSACAEREDAKPRP
jgi:hypothetical protein